MKISLIYKLDIVDYYNKITEEVFNIALDFAAVAIEISEEDRKIFWNSHKAFLCKNGAVWIKKSVSHFDTMQGSPDGAETCELFCS